MKCSNEQRTLSSVSAIARKGGWDALLVASFALLGFTATTLWQGIIRTPSSQPQDILVALVSSAGALFTLWNLLNAGIAYLSTMRALPHGLRILCSTFIARWGTVHARRILLRSGAQVAMGVGVFSCGLTSAALAAELPAPDLSSPSASTRSAHTVMASEEAAVSVPQSGGNATSYHELPRPSLSASEETIQLEKPTHIPYEITALEQSGFDGPLASPESSSSRPINPVVQDAQERMAQAQKPRQTLASSDPSHTLPAPDLAIDPTQGIRTVPLSPLPSAETASPSAAQPPQQMALPASSVHTVTPGECLWSIAAALMVDTGNDADIARAWNALYSLNRSAIGPNPDHILPGTILSVPSTF